LKKHSRALAQQQACAEAAEAASGRARLRDLIGRPWSAPFGIGNLNDNRHWAFHPHPQRT
jgi:hypothetical protein